jgi:hypothetical protein
LIEGFFRQVVTDINIRIVVIAATAAGWGFYFTRLSSPRPGAPAEPDLEEVFGPSTNTRPR